LNLAVFDRESPQIARIRGLHFAKIRVISDPFSFVWLVRVCFVVEIFGCGYAALGNMLRKKCGYSSSEFSLSADAPAVAFLQLNSTTCTVCRISTSAAETCAPGLSF
jgi:hypothetical protein